MDVIPRYTNHSILLYDRFLTQLLWFLEVKQWIWQGPFSLHLTISSRQWHHSTSAQVRLCDNEVKANDSLYSQHYTFDMRPAKCFKLVNIRHKQWVIGLFIGPDDKSFPHIEGPFDLGSSISQCSVRWPNLRRCNSAVGAAFNPFPPYFSWFCGSK